MLERKPGVSDPSLSGTMTISHKEHNNSLHSAWRDASVHLISSVSWDDLLPSTDVEKAISSMTNDTGCALRHVAPHSGVYYNEVLLLNLSHCRSLES